MFSLQSVGWTGDGEPNDGARPPSYSPLDTSDDEKDMLVDEGRNAIGYRARRIFIGCGDAYAAVAGAVHQNVEHIPAVWQLLANDVNVEVTIHLLVTRDC
jgi:hypothetical protein